MRIISVFYLILLCFLPFSLSYAQVNPSDIVNEMDEDLNIGGDIFSDFNEDIESAQVLEDERFYRYSRFYSVNLGLGLTTFTGNRGAAYDNEPPTYNLSVVYFSSFTEAFVIGIAYSKHQMVLDYVPRGFQGTMPGLVDINMLRTYFGYRHYVDTSDLGTAITYSNPYFTGQFEYWNASYQFTEQKGLIDDQKVGGAGFGLGMGLEFPIELKSTYLNVEALFHSVAFKDKYTTDYAPADSSKANGYDDLTGYVITFVVNYVLSW